MLSNAYFLAKFRFDTAENEPAKNLQKFCQFCKRRMQHDQLRYVCAGRGLGVPPNPGLGAQAHRGRARLPLLVRLRWGHQCDLAGPFL